MRILVLGAAGFIGTRLLRALADAYPDAAILATDMRQPQTSGIFERLRNVDFVTGDLQDPKHLAALFKHPLDSVFHLAAALTIDSEKDFERGMAVNVHFLLRLLEACRLQGNRPKFIFASSVSTFGGILPPAVDDDVHQNPQSSYGTHKLIGEQLVNDYSRRDFLDGRSLRLPIVLTHPGPPSASVSDRIAALIRDPFAGQKVCCPIKPDTPLAVISVDKVVSAMLKLHDIPANSFTHTRAMNLPALTITPRQIVDAVNRHLPSNLSCDVEWSEDAAVQKIVESWPSLFESKRATALGLEPDRSADEIVSAYLGVISDL